MTSFDAKGEKDKKKFLGILGRDHRERSKSLSPKVKDEVKAALEAESPSKTDADVKSSSSRPKSATLSKTVAEDIKAMIQQEEPSKQAKPSVVDAKIERLTNAELKKIYLELIAELKSTMETKTELKKQIAQLRQTLKMKPSLLSYVGLREENDKLTKTNASLQKQIDAILKPSQPTSLTKVPSNERGRSKSLVPYLDKPDMEENEAESDETVLQYITELEAVNIDELPDRRIKTKFEDGRKILRRQLPVKQELADEASNLQDALKMKPTLPQIMEMQNTNSRLKEHNKLLEEKLEQYKANPPPPEPVEAAPATATQAEPAPSEPAPVPEVTPKVSVTVNNKPTSFDQPLDDIPSQLMVTALGARYLIAADSNGKSDPYCVLKIGSWKAKTKVIKKTLEPQWNQSWRMDIREPEKQVLEVEVWDADVVGKPTLLGAVSYPLKDLPKAKEHCIWLKLQGVDSGEINLSLKALDWGKEETEPAEKKPTWNLQDTMDFMKDINEKKVIISKLEKQLAELQKQLEAKDTSISDLAREKTEQESLVKQLQSEVEAAKAASASTPAPAVQVQTSEVEESLRKELEQLRASVSDKSKASDFFQTKITGLEAKITEMESKATGLESEKTFFKSKYDEALSGKTKLEAQLKEEAEGKTALASQLDASNKKVSQLETQVKQLSESGNAGSAALQEANKQNEKLAQENASLAAKLSQLQQTSEKEVAELKAQLQEKEKHSQQLQQRLDDIEKAMEAKNATQEVDMVSLQKELAVLKSVNQNEKNKSEHLNTENTHLRKQVSELQAQNKTLALQSHDLQETTKTLQQQVKELTDIQKQAKEKESVLSTQSEQAKKLENEVKRLKTIVEEKEAEIRMRWKPDFDAHSCTACNGAFGLLNRRHHCRNCGDIFCGTCSSKKSATAKSVDPVRVCDRCFADILNSKV